ncbi:MCP four helix bundle domain-containing protein [Domibacillus sp. DTU_2020_1001157_1_SI_ALB_TIR_016]|uniref:MCP four helix bundle domain-containing protein n=1 Tax=Domibacillus sp. DTU_2020_1001157_1_SI_ALB_TIR_016 TaxID=3077789 RepID=UPI0028E23E41|nr:MCP four helix bundle domain-containing protein [Domibacillus sp. DTU_2020_1001157_1_SI_ALB_TIR_016]WNS78000.1 MCP four helix bundle domain-containing protein [Domibacillus sp. DTU_2020_1001157_1_SI_ALB_TIR_016]
MEWTTQKKLIFGLSAILLLLCLIGTASVVKMNQMYRKTDLITESWMPGLAIINNINYHTERMLTLTLLHTNTQSSEELNDIENKYQISIEKINNMMEEYEDTIYLKEDRKQFNQLKSNWTDFLQISEKTMELSAAGKSKAALSNLKNGKEPFNIMKKDITSLVTLNEKGAKYSAQEAKNYFLITRSFTIISITVALLLGIIVSVFLWKIIRTNFEMLNKLIKAEKLEVVSHLAASISHEVRNPLTSSKGFMQLIAEEDSAEARNYYINIAIEELDRAAEIINDYLTFAKPMSEKNEEINVLKEIQQCINIISPLATMNGVQISLSLTNAKQFTVSGERKKFEQGIINLLKNGIESMPHGGKLDVHLRYSDDHVQIDIRDQGIGMTQKQIQRLGEPYFTTKEKGTGLGMMVTFSIIKGMGGKVVVESEQKQGTCFSLILPIYPPAV